MKWQLGDERDDRVIKYDGWLDFHDIEAPHKQGVFIFVSKNMDVVYVGHTHKSLSEEIKDAISRGDSSGALMFSWYMTGSQNDTENLGAYWANKYRPENNKVQKGEMCIGTIF